MQRGFAILAFLALAISGMFVRGSAAHPAGLVTAVSVPGAPNCPIFPADNVWNTDISQLPVAANSAAMIQSIGLTTGLHPDFGSYLGYGIPYNVVSGSQPKVAVSFDYADESDPGPYPIPANPQIEASSDQHLLIVDKDACTLYEMWDTRQNSDGSWSAGSGAIWNLNSNALRPDGWTSADAAGLPILPGLVRYDEVAAGVIAHALRFTAQHTRNMYIYPARHDAGVNNAAYPPMGLRVRLKASVDISGFTPDVQVILSALKKYGMILADNGSNWYISGVSDTRWNDDTLHNLNQITGSDFEVVDTSTLVNGPNPTPATPGATGTMTPVPPTATATPVPPTATSTRTPLPPTATATRTSVPHTATLTATAVPPTATTTRSPIPATATSTRTAIPATATQTRTVVPTATARTTPVAPTATSTRTPIAPTATATTPMQRTVVLTPVADAYVRDGAYASDNYGTARNLVVKYAGTTGNNRNTYLRFELHGVSGTIIAATLRLYGRHASTQPWSGTESVYPVANTSWIESGPVGITWQSRPPFGQPALATTSVGETNQYYTWNVSSYVASQQTTPGAVSLLVAMDALHADGNLDQFHAREAGSNPPQLVLTVRP